MVFFICRKCCLFLKYYLKCWYFIMLLTFVSESGHLAVLHLWENTMHWPQLLLVGKIPRMSHRLYIVRNWIKLELKIKNCLYIGNWNPSEKTAHKGKKKSKDLTSIRLHISPGTWGAFASLGSRAGEWELRLSINWKAQVEASMTTRVYTAQALFTSTSSMKGCLVAEQTFDVPDSWRPLSGPWHRAPTPRSFVIRETVWENVKGFPLFWSVVHSWAGVGQRTRHWVSRVRRPLRGADLNRRRTEAQLSLAVAIIPRPLSDRWHCGISDFMAGHLSYPISFPIWWEVLAPVKFILQFEYWSNSALCLSPTPPLSLSLSLLLSLFFLYRHLQRVS